MVIISRSIKRETAARDRTRAVTVTLHPYYCVMGLKGTRQSYEVPWLAIFDLARKLAAREAIAVRVAARKR